MSTEFQYTREWTDAEAFPLLSFTKNWENPDDYPTIETDEQKVRQDMQSLHDEVKNFLNEELIPRVIAEDALVDSWEAAEGVRQENEESRVQAEQERVQAFDEMQEHAEDNFEKIDNMEVSVETLSSEKDATVSVEEDPETGGFNIKFGIPKGRDGKGVGDMERSVYDPTRRDRDVFAYVDEGLAGKADLENGMLKTTQQNGVIIYTGETTGEAATLELAIQNFVLIDGTTIMFKLHVDSGATPTLNVNSLGAKPLMQSLVKAMPTKKKGSWVTVTYYADNDFFVSSGSEAVSGKTRTLWQKMTTNTFGMRGW